MATHPAQLLTTLLLGLVAAALLAIAAWLVAGAFRRRTVRVVGARGAHHRTADVTLQVEPPPRRRALRLALAALLTLAALFGRHGVQLAYPQASAPAPAAPATTGRLASPTGATLAVARVGSGDGPVLVFTHGWGADRRDWDDLLAALPRRFDVLVWDLPGLGESSPTRDRDYAVATLARDLDAVVASTGGRPVVLVGHSIGGMINLESLRRRPQQVVAVVQVNTTYTNPIETKKNAERSRRLQEPVLEPLLHAVSALSPVARGLGWLAYRSGLAHLQLASSSFAGAESWSQLDRMARYAYRSSPDIVARGVLGMVHWDGSDVLPQVHVPTLVIAGDADTTTLPSASDHMAQSLPQAQRVTIPGAAHLGPVEQAARYADAIARFVDQPRPSVPRVADAAPTPPPGGR